MRNYAALVTQLRNVKVASAQTAQVPEKDPADKGKPAEPAIVDDAKTKATEPAGAAANTNTNDSPANPTAAPATTVSVPEKAASLVNRASAVAGTISNLLKSAKKADAPAAVVPATPAEKDKADEKKEEKAAAPAVPAATSATEKAAPAPSVPAGTEAPKGAETAKNTDSKAAAATEEVVVPEFTPEFHAKIGAAMLEFAEGREAVEKVLRMKHGAEMAEDIIKAAAFMEEHALALQQAELEGATAAEQLASEMSAEDLKVATALAEAHAYDLSNLATVEEQEAYKAAAAQAAEMTDAGMGGMDEMPEGAGGEDVSPEDILQVIEFLLSEGKISPEEAQKIVEELSQAGAGAEGGAPAEDPNLPPEEKEAMAKAAKFEQDFDALVEAAIK